MNRRQALRRIAGGAAGAGAAAAAPAAAEPSPAEQAALDREMHTRLAGVHMAHFDIAQGRCIRPDGETDAWMIVKRIHMLFPDCNRPGTPDHAAAWDYRLEYAAREPGQP